MEKTFNIKGIKNADKFTYGVQVYDTNKSIWGGIIDYDAETNEVELIGDGMTWFAKPDSLYPKVENCHLNNDKEVVVCYETNMDIDYPYFVPDYDEDFYDFEVSFGDESHENGYYDNLVETICKKNAEQLQEIADDSEVGLNNLHGTYYQFFYHVLKTKSKDNPIAFIKRYVDADVEKTYSEIVSDLANLAFTNLTSNSSCIETADREIIMDRVNCLPLADMIHLVKAKEGSPWLKRCRAELGVDKLFKTKKKYNVEAIRIEKLDVEVEAETWEEAKELAQAKLNGYPSNGDEDIRIVDTETKIKYWSKKK